MPCWGADVPARLKCFSCWAVATGICGIIGAILGIVGFIHSFWYWAGGVHAIMIIISGIIAASSGFSSCCCVRKCKTCSVVGTGIAAGLSIVGVLLLAIPYSWCHTKECTPFYLCTENPVGWEPIPSNGLLCEGDVWAWSPPPCGNRWCMWMDKDCGGDQRRPGAPNEDVDRRATSQRYWSFSNEEDCNEYASALIGWYSVTTILCVVFGWALIFITSLGAAITGFMAPTVKDIDSRIVHVNSNQAAQTVGPVVLVPTGAVKTSILVTRQDSEGNLPEHAGAGGAAL